MSYFKELKPKIYQELKNIFKVDKYSFIQIIINYCQHTTINKDNLTYESIYDMKHGYEIEYYDRPYRIKSKQFYFKDKIEGQSVTYYSDDRIHSIVPFENGKRNGIGRHYDHEGVGFSLILYEDGDFVKTVEETY